MCRCCSGPTSTLQGAQSPGRQTPASTSTIAGQLTAGAKLDTYLPDEIVDVVRAAGIRSDLYDWQVRFLHGPVERRVVEHAQREASWRSSNDAS